MTARPPKNHRRRLFLFVGTLAIATFVAWSFVSLSQRDEHVDDLKGSVTKADRLPSWLRNRAIDNLPLYSPTSEKIELGDGSSDTDNNDSIGNINDPNSRSIDGASEDGSDEMDAERLWVSHTFSKYDNHDNNDNTSNSNVNISSSTLNDIGMKNELQSQQSLLHPVIDVITISSTIRVEYQQAQREAWSSQEHVVRHVLVATEINMDNSLLRGLNERGGGGNGISEEDESGSCAYLSTVCAANPNSEVSNSTEIHTSGGHGDNPQRLLESGVSMELKQDSGEPNEILPKTNTTLSELSQSEQYSEEDAQRFSKEKLNSTSPVDQTSKPTKQEEQENHQQKMTKEEEICLQRRMGLAMGASARRYRKIVHALALESGESITNHRGYNLDGASADWKRYTDLVLPDYLIVTFDTTYFKTEMIKECFGSSIPFQEGIKEVMDDENKEKKAVPENDDTSAHNLQEVGQSIAKPIVRGENEEAPFVYAPFVSWASYTNNYGESNNSDNYRQDFAAQHKFSYPSNKLGAVFNRAALEKWIRPISCFSSEDGTLSSSFQSKTAPIPISYDLQTHELEYDFCLLITTVGRATDATNVSTMDIVLMDTLHLFLAQEQIIQNDSKSRGKALTTISISELFSMYSENMHMLCKMAPNYYIDSIHSGEKMLGYLIHRFEISMGGVVGGKSIQTDGDELKLSNREGKIAPDRSCMVSSLSQGCDPNDVFACADVSLERMRSIKDLVNSSYEPGKAL